MRRWLLIPGFVGGFTLSATSCGDEVSSDEVCTPGKVETCPCPGGEQGTQACNADGNGYDDCQCPNGDGDGADADACKDATGSVLIDRYFYFQLDRIASNRIESNRIDASVGI